MVTHPIPGNGYVPPSKILVAGLAAAAVVTTVFSVQKGSAFVPRTINRDWEDASFDRLAKTTFEGAPDVTYHANPFYNDIKQNQYLKSA